MGAPSSQPLKVGQYIDIQAALQQAEFLFQKGHLAQAQAFCQNILQQNPHHVPALHLAAGISHQTGQNNAAASLLEKAISLHPNDPVMYGNLALIYIALDRFDDAITASRKALQLDPGCDIAHTNQGIALRAQGKISEAIQHFRRVARLNPNDAAAHGNLGLALQYRGLLDEAIRCYRKALLINPAYNSGLLLCINYSTTMTQDEIYSEHRSWGDIHGHHITPCKIHHNVPDPGKRLRIGYISPDLHFHSVAFFIAPVLAHHNKENVEVFCYAEVPNPDQMTEELASYADHWRNTCGKSNAEIAEQIRADGIDILIDLAGHAGNKRLPVFSHKPAPVQVTWLGYPNTTGLDTMDYLITDPFVAPPGKNDQYYSETLIRLPRTFACYRPPANAPEVTALPALETGHVTFGSFNNIMKLNQGVIALWAKVLKAIPQSTLLLQTRSLADPEISQEIRQRFASHGICEDRLQTHGNMSFMEYLEQHNRIDIILDTFPWHGHTNTCHALWMGVPVIVLAGERHASRMGISVMKNLGLPDLVAHDESEYINIATRLACDLRGLQKTRETLRRRLMKSPVCDGMGFTREIEAAYRDMWGKWCAQKRST